MRRIVGTGLAAALALVGCAPHDYDGDGAADLAFWSIDGNWYRAADVEPLWDLGRVNIPVPGDYDGSDGWEPAAVLGDGTWRTTESAGDLAEPPPFELVVDTYDGWTFEPVPVPGDYDGDGTTDPAWYDPVAGEWYVPGHPGPLALGTGAASAGVGADTPVPADYDGDGDTDPATYSPVSGTLAIAGQPTRTGLPIGIPVAGRLDGNPGAELIVWDPVGTAWRHPGGPVIDVPVDGGVIPTLADFDGDRVDDLVVFGYFTGAWYDTGGVALASDPRAVHGLPTTTPSATIMDLVRLIFRAECAAAATC